MNKTKLGISVCMAAGLVYLLTTVSAIVSSSWLFVIPLVLLTGYVMLKEENLWLKSCCVKAIVVVAVFAIINGILLGFANDIIAFLNFFLQFADISINDGWNIIGFFVNIISVIEKILLILLTIFAFKGKTIKLPVIDNLINKHMG